jgi:hypothetical protein
VIRTLLRTPILRGKAFARSSRCPLQSYRCSEQRPLCLLRFPTRQPKHHRVGRAYVAAENLPLIGMIRHLLSALGTRRHRRPLGQPADLPWNSCHGIRSITSRPLLAVTVRHQADHLRALSRGRLRGNCRGRQRCARGRIDPSRPYYASGTALAHTRSKLSR